jgi:hypothetical protein
MKITQACGAYPWIGTDYRRTHALDAEEWLALELQLENGSATLTPLGKNGSPYTHRLTASDGWVYYVAFGAAGG